MVLAEALTRTFDERVAVDRLSFGVEAGEVVSLLGPNGAGKTTTFRMLAGLLLPSGGHARVDGIPLDAKTADRIRARVGLLTEAPGLWERLSVRWNLRTYARLHGVANEARRLDAVMADTGIAARADERAGSLSKGLKQRVALARALIHDPPVVLLDEPTSGLDPASARDVRGLVLRLRDAGRAVLVSTHNLAEAEAISDRVAVLSTRLLAFDTPANLLRRLGAVVIEIEMDGDAASFRGIVERTGATIDDVEATRLRLRLGTAPAVADVVAALVHAGARVQRVEPQTASLEEAYLSLVRADE